MFCDPSRTHPHSQFEISSPKPSQYNRIVTAQCLHALEPSKDPEWHIHTLEKHPEDLNEKKFNSYYTNMTEVMPETPMKMQEEEIKVEDVNFFEHLIKVIDISEQHVSKKLLGIDHNM